MSNFVELESFKHKAAKELLASWLRNLDNTQDGCLLSPISWRSNYGVFEELKFHETDDPYYFEMSSGLINYELREGMGLGFRPKTNTDWFKSDFDRGRILFVPDITIFHKGVAAILVEILHKHEVPDKKLNIISDFFSGQGVTLFEIRAEDILKLTKIPTELEIHRKIEF